MKEHAHVVMKHSARYPSPYGETVLPYWVGDSGSPGVGDESGVLSFVFGKVGMPCTLLCSVLQAASA